MPSSLNFGGGGRMIPPEFLEGHKETNFPSQMPFSPLTSIAVCSRVIRVVGGCSRGPKSVAPPHKMKVLEIGLKSAQYLYKFMSV